MAYVSHVPQISIKWQGACQRQKKRNKEQGLSSAVSPTLLFSNV